MATYKKNTIKKALAFWETKLDESKKTAESEEDQKKEAAKKQADEEQAEIDAADDTDSDDDADANVDDADSDDSDNDSDSDEDTDSTDDFDPDADFEQAMGDEGGDANDIGFDTDGETGDDSFDAESTGSDDDSDDDSADDDEDSGEDEEDSDEGAEEEDDSEDDESEFKLEITAPSKKLLDSIPDLCKKFGSKVSVTVAGLDPEGDDEEGGYVTAIECQDEETLNAVKEEDAVKEAVGGMDGELNESLQYEPNTVGAVIKLLSKSDPRDFLFIRLAPNMKQCMIYDIDRKVMTAGQSTTYLEIAIGDPTK